MKDTEIHNGLEQKELRDFFSESIYKTNFDTTELSEKKYKINDYDCLIENLKIDLSKINSEIKKYETLKSIFLLMKNMGWDEFDCSDFTIRTGKFYRSFIGTKKEYDDLFNK